MELLRWIAGFLLTLTVAGFAIFNRQSVEVYYSPLHDPAVLPLCVAALGFMAAGFIAGAVTVWLNAAPQRRRSRSQRKHIRALERELAESAESTAQTEPLADFFPALTKQERPS